MDFPAKQETIFNFIDVFLIYGKTIRFLEKEC